MALRPAMTWEPAKSRWRKMHRGKVYTVSCRELGTPATKEASYQPANRWWTAKLAEIEGIKLPHPHEAELVKLRSRRDWAKRHGVLDVVENLGKEVQRIENGDPPHDEAAFMLRVYQDAFGLDPGTTPPELLLHLFGKGEVWDDRLEMDEVDAIPQDHTVGGQVTRWLETQEAKVGAGKMNPAHFDNRRRCLLYFQNFMGEGSKVELINENKVEQYYLHLIAKVAARRADPSQGWSMTYAGIMFGVTQTFIRYIWSKKLIDLPRNLDGFDFKSSPKKIETVTVEEFRTLVDHAPGQLKLHLLLMANCGMTQADIADLKNIEVDWTLGRITRKRSKTKDRSDVPVVSYPLWGITFDLLKEYRSQGEYALLTKTGGRWAWEELVDGKLKSADNIASNYTHLKRKLMRNRHIVCKPLKLVRKTSASLLERHEHYGRYKIHFLGHSPQSIADKHYAVPSVELFDKIVRWLGEQYGY